MKRINNSEIIFSCLQCCLDDRYIWQSKKAGLVQKGPIRLFWSQRLDLQWWFLGERSHSLKYLGDKTGRPPFLPRLAVFQGPEIAHKHLAHKQFLGHPGHRSSRQANFWEVAPKCAASVSTSEKFGGKFYKIALRWPLFLFVWSKLGHTPSTGHSGSNSRKIPERLQKRSHRAFFKGGTFTRGNDIRMTPGMTVWWRSAPCPPPRYCHAVVAQIWSSLNWEQKKKTINRKHINIFLTALVGQSSQGRTPTRPRDKQDKMAILLWNLPWKGRFVPGTGPILSRGGVPFVPGTVPVPETVPPKMFMFIGIFLARLTVSVISKQGSTPTPWARGLRDQIQKWALRTQKILYF